jgi:hypothetical protein
MKKIQTVELETLLSEVSGKLLLEMSVGRLYTAAPGRQFTYTGLEGVTNVSFELVFHLRVR